jgi:hypothetical protein
VPDGRSLLAELQADGLADRDLDYDAVIAELAQGAPPMFVLASRLSQSPVGSSVITSRQREVMDELVAIARAPFLAMTAPPEPNVSWGRLADDLARTAGRRLDVTLRWDQYPDGGDWICEFSLDGVGRGSCRVQWDGNDAEACLADLAGQLCEAWLHEDIWGGWPMCPVHATRPMWASVNEAGMAIWRCEAEASDEVIIGQLGL